MKKIFILGCYLIISFVFQSPVPSEVAGIKTINKPDLLKPKIFSIKPLKGFAANRGYNGTEVLIKGSKFSKIKNKNVVLFGNKTAEIVTADENNIIVRVPLKAVSGRIRVKTQTGIAESQKIFTIIGEPRINNIFPLEAKPGEQIEISGKNFLDTDVGNKRKGNPQNILDEGFLRVKFGESEAEIINASENEITALVPDSAQTGRIKVITPAGFSISRRDFVVEKLPGTVSGKLAIQPYITLNEEEPNNSLNASQALNNLPVIIFGNASSSDEGYTQKTTLNKIQDIFYLFADNAVEIFLESENGESDFDLFIMDAEGNTILSSEGRGNDVKEFLEYNPSFPELIYIGVKAFSGSDGYNLTLDRPIMINSASDNDIDFNVQDFVPGEFIVKFKKQFNNSKRTGMLKSFKITRPLTSGLTLLEFDDADRILQKRKNLYSTRTKYNKKNVYDYKEDFKILTLEILKKLRKLPEVEMADLNYIRKPYIIPDDKYYNLQWHYPAINLPQAWDITKGSNDIVVAVVDTGIVSEHPDLSSMIAQGYDFISNIKISLDGDGIDNNPEDTGDDPKKIRSSFHGTHVAGTIGSATNNSIGVAGVMWDGKIMPLRALGAGGGTDYDVIQACLYAAGLPNDSGTVPQKRADVINMSLGGAGFSQVFQNKIKEILQEGVVIVAAAGNENTTNPSYPASFEGVISVGAINLSLKKASYSNYGPTITVVAPGGSSITDVNNDGYVDGVLSTLADDSGDLFYGFYQGTSMASPHVAGVIGLMQASRIEKGLAFLTPENITEILISTAMDLGDTGKDDIYGYGLVDAQRAVEKAVETTRETLPVLSLSSNSMNFGDRKSQLSFSITNSGGGTLIVESITGDMPWLLVSPSSGTISETGKLIVTVDVDRTGLDNGNYYGTINIISNGVNRVIDVAMQVGDFSQRDIGLVYLLVVNRRSFETVSETETDLDKNFEYMVSGIDEGKYFVIAGTDRNNDGYICDEGEACGVYPTMTDPKVVSVISDNETSEINFEVNERSSIFSSELMNHKFKLKRKSNGTNRTGNR